MRSLKFHYFSDKQTLYKVWMASPNIPSVIVIQKKKKKQKEGPTSWYDRSYRWWY